MTQLLELVTLDPPAEKRFEGPAAVARIADLDTRFGTLKPRIVAAGFDLGSGLREAQPGDVLLARISPSMENGKVAIVPDADGLPIFVSREFYVLRPESDVDPSIIWAYFRRDAVRHRLALRMTGSTGRKRLPRTVLGAVDIPNPPLWGTRLAALEHLDKAVELRHESIDLLRRLPGAAATAVAARKTEGRFRTSLGELVAPMKYGSSVKVAGQGEIPVLRIPNVVDGWIDPGDLRYLPAERDESEVDLLQPGDMLLVRAASSRDRLGSVAMYEGEPRTCTYASYLLRIRPTDPALRDFLWAWLQSHQARSHLLRASQSNLGRSSLTPVIVSELPVPMLGSEEVDEVAAVARHTRQALRFARAQQAQLDRLRQAHLATAFGEPVESPSPVADPAPRTMESPQRAPADHSMPEALRGASQEQMDAWYAVARHDNETFAPADLGLGSTARAELQHSLMLFEHLGLVVRESSDVSRWHRPDPTFDLIP